MKSNDAGYIHGTSPDEQRRLSDLNELVNRPALEQLALAGGERVLDVGSGLGQLSRACARAAGPRGRVIGIERSAEQLARARELAEADGEAALVDFRTGDALALPLSEAEWGSFDIAHTRFLLEHVSDPQAVVRGMARAVRSGGRVALQDDDHDVLRLWPEPPGVMPVWRAYLRTYDRLGCDAFVGRRLVQLLHGAGLRPTRNQWLWFGGCSGDPRFEALIANFEDILRGARAATLATAGCDAEQFDAALEQIAAFGRRPDAAMWYAICWAEGVKP